jgi:hypothetical protein
MLVRLLRSRWLRAVRIVAIGVGALVRIIAVVVT